MHRLVRISPYDSNARRHTSFSSVAIFPVVDNSIKIDINESDVRTDTMRSGGAGGQHVNKTESAVRLTHIPTGVAVVCQAGRSQHKNRAQAWDMLRARLYEIELKKREEQAAADQAAKTDIGWGHQIRSYVLQPYQMVKDLRTGVQTSDTSGVLDGDLDEFMAATLAQRAFGTAPGAGRGRGLAMAQGRLHRARADGPRHGRPLSRCGLYASRSGIAARPKAEDLIARGARWAASPAEAADGADAVVTMVADDEASRSVWLGENGAAAKMKAGSLAIECSTVSHQHALDMARELRGRGLIYIDCPVTGLPQAAAAGKLTLLVGADAGRPGPGQAVSRADRRYDQALRRGRHRHGLQADQQPDGRGADREPRRRHRHGRTGRARHESGGGGDGDRRGGKPAGDPALQAHGGARFLRRVVHRRRFATRMRPTR